MISITECKIEGKVKHVLLVTKGKAASNLIKHLTDGNEKAIQKQVDRGSVQVFGTVTDKPNEAL